MKNCIANPIVRLSALLAVSLSPSLASAAITGVTGNITWLGSPPLACTPGALTGTTAYTWNEQQNVSLSLFANMVNNPGTSTSPIPGPVTGTLDSHFIHFDGLAGVINATGTVTFSTPIVGVIFRALDLDASDGPAGSPSTIYPTTYPFRGLMTNPPSFCSILGNTISINLNSLAPTADVAQIRVITQAPAPATAGLLAMGALALGRRRRRA